MREFNREKIFPCNGYVFDTHTEIQNAFIERIKSDGIDEAVKWLKEIKKEELSYPDSLMFRWKGEAGDCFELSKMPDFSDAYSLICSEPFCQIDNLEIGTEYFWRINKGEPSNFYTKDNGIRFIKIDGALNVRDIGGINIKQGLIFRGSAINGIYRISEAGKDTFCNKLKIKTEMELRTEAEDKTVSEAGEDIDFEYFPYRPYKEVFEEKHKSGICKIMTFLSEKNNYPVYIHCLGGADRTGMIALYLRALAGESDEMIHLDYEMTSLSSYAYGLAEGAAKDGFRRRTDSYYTEFLDRLDCFAPGKPLSEKVRAFLSDCGVSRECLEQITSIIKV